MKRLLRYPDMMEPINTLLTPVIIAVMTEHIDHQYIPRMIRMSGLHLEAMFSAHGTQLTAVNISQRTVIAISLHLIFWSMNLIIMPTEKLSMIIIMRAYIRQTSPLLIALIDNMSFTWSSIDVGSIIRKSHIDEIRSNIDSILDNIACITDKTSYNNGYNSGVLSNDHGTYKNGVNSSVDNDDHGTYNGSYVGSDDNSVNDSYHNGDHATEKAGYNSTFEDNYVS